MASVQIKIMDSKDESNAGVVVEIKTIKSGEESKSLALDLGLAVRELCGYSKGQVEVVLLEES
jgi:hypothetical protein